MGLLPLEFTDGLTDSPYFRETLQAHEKELDLTNTAIKHLIKDIKDLIVAARNLSRAQRTLSETLNNFNFECIGNSQTDDELVIANSFKDFARLLTTIEDERDRLLEKADEAFLEPIERFRREQIGSAKEAKKKFDKETAKYCQNLERYLNISMKKNETQLWEADANNSMEQQHFFKAMSEYVLKLQEVNERKKFEFVETVLSFMLGWLTFYHQGHEIATDFYSVKMELQMRLQRTRSNFNMTQEETKSLRQKMLNNQEKFKQKFQDARSSNEVFQRQGYLFLMEKKAFSTSWVKHFCKYEKDKRRLTIIQFTQTVGKIVLKLRISTDSLIVNECVKRNQDSIDRRFCFDIITYVEDKSPSSTISSNWNTAISSSSLTSSQINNNSSIQFLNNCNQNFNLTGNNAIASIPNSDNIVHTFQALSEEDYKYWLEILDARDPYPNPSHSLNKSNKHQLTSNKQNPHQSNINCSPHSQDSMVIDLEGYWFVKKCIQMIESRGINFKGIYRVVGVTSRVRALMEIYLQCKSKSLNTLTSQSLMPVNQMNAQDYLNFSTSLNENDLLPNFNLDDSEEFEIKTITSALKSYLRQLSEPIMTFKLHNDFVAAAKLENRAFRIEKIHQLVHRLPAINFSILKILIEHLNKVSKLHDKNLMTSSNLGVCFGPTLLRTAEESVAAILDIKFVNVIAELLIENYEKPQANTLIQQRPLPSIPGQTSQYVPIATSTMKAINNNNSNLNKCTAGIVSNRNLTSSSPHSMIDTLDNRFNLSLPTDVRRSNSQDQLCISTTSQQHLKSSNFVQSQNRMLYGTARPFLTLNNSSTSSLVQHPQHSKQYMQYIQSPKQNYSAFHSQLMNDNRSNCFQSVPPSSSPSSLSSTTASGFMKPSPMVPSVSSPYDQRHSNQQLQASISYQNLHQNLEIPSSSIHPSNETSKSKSQSTSSYHSNLLNNRPMTSIGIIPPNSTYSSIVNFVDPRSLRPNFYSNTYENQNERNNLYETVDNQTASLQKQKATPLPSNFSPTSSSIQTSPEHHHRHTVQHPSVYNNSLMTTASSIGSDNDSLTEMMKEFRLRQNKANKLEQQKAIYGYLPGSIRQQQQSQQRPSNIFTDSSQTSTTTQKFIYDQYSHSPPISNRTVRTRYVCIGGSDSELSFQPNMIITNVRTSKEPGWLEGNLNGKTGLIPLNYVEFID
ncbi:Oligophrenin-1 [Sarcoptes scabiei]|uniref:Oligophrenin-1 n=1 Tax=Sarcoptes scabiei TaxID=52283 RepID=A0A834VCU1_SARSC|nr:Oligophrenin-1 [Sarcoptes scabiei]